MPARMPRRLLMLLCLVAVTAFAAACGEADVEQGVEEPAREGLAVDMGGIDYNVFITRQLKTMSLALQKIFQTIQFISFCKITWFISR